MKKIHLFCFPYAGGSSMMYFRWRNQLSEFIEVHPIELAGRGRRMNEPFYNSIDEAVEDAYLSIPVHLISEPFAFFGYSMGSLIAYELAHYIREKHDRELKHLFVGARRAPHLNEKLKRISELSDRTFLEEMIKLGGMSEEVLENQELLDVFLPLIRADMRLVENYEWKTRDLLHTDITVLAGNQDVIAVDQMEAWKETTSGACQLSVYEGDHFFIHKHYEVIAEQIKRVLI